MRLEFVLPALALIAATACSPHTPARPAPASADESPVCAALVGRFLALPSSSPNPHAEAPTTGRWWIRGCSSRAAGPELQVTLTGPAWTWVQVNDPPFHLRQHVYFHVESELRGEVDARIGARAGVISLWFKTTGSSWRVEPVGPIRPHPNNALASALQFLAAPIPGLNVERQARQALELEATSRFRDAVASGFTVVYDVALGQADFAVGLLPEGERPEHPFADGSAWLVNERLLAAPGGVHVLGPFQPAQSLELDARITRGPGLKWQVVCDSDLEHALAPTADGRPAEIPAAAIRAEGVLQGPGVKEMGLGAVSCRSYLVVSAKGRELTAAAIRVRPA